MRPDIEDRYIDQIDRPSEREIKKRSFWAEQLTTDVINQKTARLEARLSTKEEDSGVRDIRPGLKTDSVAYLKGKERLPVFAMQITSSDDPKVWATKMKELAGQPFVFIEGRSVPKTLVFLSRSQVTEYPTDRDFSRHPETPVSVLQSIIKSLEFSLTQTKNPHEQRAIKDLINMLEEDKRKLVF